jgi:ABC-type microcin C transport system permease subunit YejB
MSWVSLWNLNTGLVGFDFLLNAYLNLQFTPEGRWSLLGISALVFLLAVAYGISKDINLDELIDTNTSTGAWVVFSAALPSLIVISPMWIALFAGLMSKIFGVP